jgi:hypothetical protein
MLTQDNLNRIDRGGTRTQKNYTHPYWFTVGKIYLSFHSVSIKYSPTSGGRSVGIVRSRTQTMEFSFSFLVLNIRDFAEFRNMVYGTNAIYCPLVLTFLRSC